MFQKENMHSLDSNNIVPFCNRQAPFIHFCEFLQIC
jgi:hypothetical protein